MRRVYLTNLDITLKGDRALNLNVDVGPNPEVQTDGAGKLTALKWTDPPGDALPRLLYVDPAEVVAITATDYWEDHDDEEEDEDNHGDVVELAAAQDAFVDEQNVVVVEESGPLTAAAVAEVQRIVGETATE